MKRLDKYLAGEFVKLYLLAIIALSVIGLVGAVVDNLADYLHGGYSPAAVARVFLWMIPGVFVQFSPLAVLISVLVTLGLMGKHREMLILEGSGLFPLRFLAPFFILGGLLIPLVFLVNETIVPASFSRIKPRAEISNPTLALPQFFFYAEKFRTAENLFEKPNILIFYPEGNLKEIYRGERCLIEKDGQWVIESGLRVMFSVEGEVLDDLSFTRRSFDFQMSREDLEPLLEPVQALSLRQLVGYLARLNKAGLDPVAIRTAVLSHLSYPLLNIFVVFLTLPLAFSRRFSRPALVTLGFLLAMFTYWLFSFGLALGNQGYLPPALAAFLPQIVILLGAFLFLCRSLFDNP
ncbi:MAG: LptF/LptG family permease [Candidatus Omnitrophica bacterium]|nr:LptF/LptG family permease [Candidatus Omnitrophota bacterium]